MAAEFSTHTHIVIPHIQHLAPPQHAKRWLPAMVEGRRIGAIAMTEPERAQGLRGNRTSARRTSDGWVLDGSRTFIAIGLHADLVVLSGRHSFAEADRIEGPLVRAGADHARALASEDAEALVLVAQELIFSVRIVEGRLQRVYARLGVGSRSELAEVLASMSSAD